ncbi:nucleobindin-2 isoform X2 [Leptidea sinapis]|uniref:nucleobindin-2 isoform X2 n=1 Tax=Leptidea sinapis TaxID=189913 RepID=UPI002140E672|nr:nucleobindin-2 isoform X2 [Leptidea sinapis]
MRPILYLMLLIAILHCSYAPPVNEKAKEDSEIKDDLEEYMEYHRYLKEVVQALESDPEFNERLEKADEDDIRTGRIAEQLDFVNHNVRSKLDEIKRRELERLRHLATKQFELENNLEHEGKVASSDHLDHQNPHTFEIEDLKKLIKKTTADLEVADKQRKEQFKEYEMQKEFEKHQKLEALDEAKKKEYMEKMKAEEEAKKHHKPIHHPGSKQQLEEVWEKQDHMDQQFDPKAFFMMHDVDGNGVWDADEVKALFIKELDKVYGPGGPNKDMHERAEEMERMREHVFKEYDKNRDGLIDFQEFMLETQRANFNQDEGWKSIDENQIYSQAEYAEYERRRLEELAYLQQRGLVDAHGRPVPGAERQLHQYQQQKLAYHQQQQQAYQQAQYQGQQFAPPGQQGYQQHPNQMPQYPQGQPQHQGQQPPAQQPPQGNYQQQQYQQQGQFQPQQQGQQPPVQGQASQDQHHSQQAQAQGQIPQTQFQSQQGQQQQAQAQPSQGQFQQQQGQPPQDQLKQQQAQQTQGQFQQQQGQPQGQFQQQQGQPQGQFQQQQGQPPQGQLQQQQAQQPQGQFQQPQVQGQPPVNANINQANQNAQIKH